MWGFPSSTLLLPGSIFAIQKDLTQNGEVDHDLKTTADDKLERGLPDDEVACLEDVSARPHNHHLKAETKKSLFIFK